MVAIAFKLLLSALVGLIFAASARAQFHDGRSPFGRELLAVLSFEALAMGPFTLYLCLVHPDWSYMYLVDPSSLSGFAVAVLLLADLAILVGAYAGGYVLVRRFGIHACNYAIAAVALFMAIFAVAARGRLFHYGTFTGYGKGQLLPLYQTKLFFTLAVGSIGTAVGAFTVGAHLQGEGRRRSPPKKVREDATSRFQPPPTLTADHEADDPHAA